MPQRRGWVPDDADFGARLALVRQRMGGMNMTKMGHLCGVDPESWRNWESGKTKPRDLADIAGKIARATGADYLWLMVGSAVPEAVVGGRDEAAVGEDYAARAQAEGHPTSGGKLGHAAPARLYLIRGGRARQGVAA